MVDTTQNVPTMTVMVQIPSGGGPYYEIPNADFDHILAAAEHELESQRRRQGTKFKHRAALQWVLKMRGVEQPMRG